MRDDVTTDGYRIVPYRPRETERQREVGLQCGKCSIKIKHGATMAYCCPSGDCPMGFGPQTAPTFSSLTTG